MNVYVKNLVAPQLQALHPPLHPHTNLVQAPVLQVPVSVVQSLAPVVLVPVLVAQVSVAQALALVLVAPVPVAQALVPVQVSALPAQVSIPVAQAIAHQPNHQVWYILLIFHL